MSVTSAPVSDGARPERSSHPWKRYRNPLLVAGAAVVLASGLLLKHHLAGYESTDDAQVDAHLYAISARVPGYVVAVPVNDHQYVKQGELLGNWIDRLSARSRADPCRAGQHRSHRGVAIGCCANHLREYVEPVGIFGCGGPECRREHSCRQTAGGCRSRAT